MREAITRNGGAVVGDPATARGLVASFGSDKGELRSILDSCPSIEWVQLPSAGIEAYASSIFAHPELQWTSAKGAYAAPVAEHALALTLALLRQLHSRARASAWGTPAGTSLHGLRVLVLGAGGVAEEIVRLMKAFDTRVTVVRRSSSPVPRADATFSTPSFASLLPDTDVLVLAAALTDDTRGIVGADALQALPEHAVVVNIGRGGLLDTEALTAALAAGDIAGAALDVTDPEPLPDDHALWSEPRALVTPHTADTPEMIEPLLAERTGTNVARLVAGDTLLGVVDTALGY